MTPPLAIVGHLEVPAAVLKHRFYIEALACAMMFDARHHDGEGRVIGTANTKQCELYGWAPNVDSHVDKTGWVYGVALNAGRTTVAAWPMKTDDDLVMVELPAGAVFRLDDHVMHWTEDAAPRVAAFVGSFEAPNDAAALAILRDGIAALARGDYYGAPRVREAFRCLLPDECLVSNEAMTDYEPMLLADALRAGRFVIPCASCGKPAVRVDNHWPYHWDTNRCRDHMAPAEPAPALAAAGPALLDEPIAPLTLETPC